MRRVSCSAAKLTLRRPPPRGRLQQLKGAPRSCTPGPLSLTHPQYWYRTLSHPLLPQLYGDKAPVQQACALVDAVQAVTRGAGTACGAGRLAELKARQAEELRVLLQWTLEQEQAK